MRTAGPRECLWHAIIAAEITKNGGIALCAPIAPYDEVRKEVRPMIQQTGAAFVLLHISMPLPPKGERGAPPLLDPALNDCLRAILPRGDEAWLSDRFQEKAS